MSNAYPSIPDPQNNIESLADSVRALKMAVETLVGQRDGGRASRVFTQTSEPEDPQSGDMWMVANDAGAMRIWNGYFWVDISDSRFSESGGGTATSLSSTALATITDTINPTLEALNAEIDAAFAQTSKVTTELNKQIGVARTEFEDLINGLQGQTSFQIQAASATSFAQVKQEEAARITAVDSVAGRVTTIESSVNDPNTGGGLLARVITEEATRATKDSALAGYVTKVSAGYANVYTQATQPVSPSRGDTWFDTSNNYFPYFYNGTTWLDNSNGTYAVGTVGSVKANLDIESITRVTADTALAKYITRASVGSGPVYVQDTAPASPPIGAIWYSTANPLDLYHPYYWNGSQWLDNNTGAYGSVATISTDLGTVQNKVNNTLGAQWAVKANINNTTSGLTFTGIQRADGTGAVYTFEIGDSSGNSQTAVKIYGNAVVDGTLGATKIATTSLSAITANLGTVTAGVARDTNSKFIIDFNNANITISD